MKKIFIKKLYLIIFDILFFTTILKGSTFILSSPSLNRNATRGYNNDSSAIYYNPSFMTEIDSSLIATGFFSYYNPSYFNSFYFTYQKHLNKSGTAGFLWNRYFSSDKLTFFDYYEDTFLLSYAHILNEYLKPAILFKILNKNSDSGAGMGYTVSFSFMITPIDSYYLTFIFVDILNSNFRWSTGRIESFKPEFILSTGYILNLKKFKIIFSAESLIRNIKIKDFYISYNFRYPSYKGGVSFKYLNLELGCGISYTETYEFTTGLSFKIFKGGKISFTYIPDTNDMGSSSGISLEYKY